MRNSIFNIRIRNLYECRKTIWFDFKIRTRFQDVFSELQGIQNDISDDAQIREAMRDVREKHMKKLGTKLKIVEVLYLSQCKT